MVGTCGTGKTETALTLAELLYGGEQNMTVINMSEFKEEQKCQHADGQPSRLCRLRRGRRAHRGGAPAALLRGAARRDGKGAPRRAGHLLPGVRQGQDEGRRRPRHRLQEHHHHHDVQRRHRPDHETVRRPRHPSDAGALAEALLPNC